MTEAPDCLMFCADGDVLSSNIDSIRTAIEKLFTQTTHPKMLHLDLRAARLIDSVGLNLIVTFIRRIKQCGGTARITVGNSAVRRILAFTRIDQHAEVVMA